MKPKLEVDWKVSLHDPETGKEFVHLLSPCTLEGIKVQNVTLSDGLEVQLFGANCTADAVIERIATGLPGTEEYFVARIAPETKVDLTKDKNKKPSILLKIGLGLAKLYFLGAFLFFLDSITGSHAIRGSISVLIIYMFFYYPIVRFLLGLLPIL